MELRRKLTERPQEIHYTVEDVTHEPTGHQTLLVIPLKPEHAAIRAKALKELREATQHPELGGWLFAGTMARNIQEAKEMRAKHTEAWKRIVGPHMNRMVELNNTLSPHYNTTSLAYITRPLRLPPGTKQYAVGEIIKTLPKGATLKEHGILK
ncbi:hypothetical protein H0O03_04180 [Candidatus Micrarchaeota archaeon]|nr:hypothetical protein [Candidatus Micrarchaeota archaeon]